MFSLILFARRFGASLALAACLLSAERAGAAAPILSYKVVAEYPHSTDSYTEGFLYLDGLFYEGTGIAGRSALLAIQPETGKPVQRLALAPQYFGEGIVDYGPNVYQWTWQSHTCFVYEGWIICRAAKLGICIAHLEIERACFDLGLGTGGELGFEEDSLRFDILG